MEHLVKRLAAVRTLKKRVHVEQAMCHNITSSSKLFNRKAVDNLRILAKKLNELLVEEYGLVKTLEEQRIYRIYGVSIALH